MTAALGFVPYPAVFNLLKTDADFIQTIRTADGSDWPVGTNVVIRLFTADGAYTTDWPSSIVDDTINWEIDKAVVAAVHAATTGKSLLGHVIYNDGATEDLVWFSGKVKWGT